ncbi:hypothetical protein SAMN04515671_4422 [Nakamurella panacisegetis]|uniref:YCII-related domain-containing protein n=1 Tax=Nakamurella panacisegetis TaxID=1090615 RepID=A0A1H0T2W1_9ACTN|nr:YciI family protein [Nakamurella panacisegetis]SDP48050.1 hypothetical protein SAMN04515671_4422 [Nakamurella panacisegetis]
MPVFAVLYDYAKESDAGRDQHRPAHREFLGSLTGPVTALATGPWGDEPAGALIIVEGPSAGEVAAKLDDDPFQVQQLISARRIREWTQVKGPWA